MDDYRNHRLGRTFMASVRLLKLQERRCSNWARVSARSELNESVTEERKFSIKVPA
jgi:hypothetical protein